MQERKERNEASWKELQEARHSDAQARKAAEEGRREVEAKWKAAQEAWKARPCTDLPSFYLDLRSWHLYGDHGALTERAPAMNPARSAVCSSR